MRFIVTFFVVALTALALTWYVGYDYNTYEYQLIKAIVVKVVKYIDVSGADVKDVHPKTSETDDKSDVSSDDKPDEECYSWSTLNFLMEKLFTRVFENWEVVHGHPSHKLTTNLTVDVDHIKSTIEQFHSRLTLAIGSIPDYLFPARIIFESMQKSLYETRDKLVELYSELMHKIDADYSKSREAVVYQFAKFLQKMSLLVEAEEDLVLECICTAAVQLDHISMVAMINMNYCIDEAELRFRDIFNATRIGLNNNLEHTVDLLTKSKTSPVSMFDNFFQLPVHVRIIQINKHSMFPICGLI